MLFNALEHAASDPSLIHQDCHAHEVLFYGWYEGVILERMMEDSV